MDHSMDLVKENEEYKLGIKRVAAKNRTAASDKDELRVTCHMYLAHRTSLFLGTSSGLLLMWKPKNEFHAEIVRTDLGGHRGTIFDLLYLGDEAAAGGGWGHQAGAASLSNLVASCSADRTVKIWDVFERDLKQRCIQTLIGHDGSVTSMTFLRGSLITCSTDNSVRIWRSSPERSLLLYPFFEVCQEIWGPGGSTIPASLASILGQPPPPSSLSPTRQATSLSNDKSVLKSCPFVVGRLVRAEQQLLFVGDNQGRVYTFVPPARAGFGSVAAAPTALLQKERSDDHKYSSAESSLAGSIATSLSNTPRQTSSTRISSAQSSPNSTQFVPASQFNSIASGNPTSSMFEFSRSHKIHALSVSKMLIVPQESLIITLSFDHTVQVHDSLSSNGYFGIENPTRCRYLAMDWDTRHQELILSDELGYIQVWNIYIEKCLKSIKLKNEAIYSLSLHSPNKLLIGLRDGIEIYTIQRNVKFNEFKGHEAPIVQLLQIHSSSLSNINFSNMGNNNNNNPPADGSTDLTTTHGGGKRKKKEEPTEPGSVVRQTSSGRLIPTLAEVKAISNMVSEEKYLYSASLDYTIRQWDSYDMTCLSIIKERSSEISCMAYLPGSIILCTGHDDGTIRMWNIDSGTYMNLIHHRNTISALVVAKTPRQDCLISCSFDKTIAVWDVTKQRNFNPIPEFHLKVSEEEVLCATYHQTLGLIFTGGNDTLIHMWSMENRCKEGVFRGHKNAVGALALDGDFLISGSDDCSIMVWNIRLQYVVCVLTGHDLSIRDLIVVPTYGYIVSASFDGRVIVWNYLNASAIKQFHHPDKRFRCLLYDAAQRKVFAGTEESRIMFFMLPDEIFPDPVAQRKRLLKHNSEEEEDLFPLPPETSPIASPTANEEEKKESGATAAGASPTASPNPANARIGSATASVAVSRAPTRSASVAMILPTSPNAAAAPAEAPPAAAAGAAATSPQPSDTARLAHVASTNSLSDQVVNVPTGGDMIDYGPIVELLTQQSLRIQVLLNTVKPLPPKPTLRDMANGVDPTAVTVSSKEKTAAGGAGAAAAALKRQTQVNPSIHVPSAARRASLTNSNMLKDASAAFKNKPEAAAAGSSPSSVSPPSVVSPTNREGSANTAATAAGASPPPMKRAPSKITLDMKERDKEKDGEKKENPLGTPPVVPRALDREPVKAGELVGASILRHAVANARASLRASLAKDAEAAAMLQAAKDAVDAKQNPQPAQGAQEPDSEDNSPPTNTSTATADVPVVTTAPTATASTPSVPIEKTDISTSSANAQPIVESPSRRGVPITGRRASMTSSTLREIQSKLNSQAAASDNVVSETLTSAARGSGAGATILTLDPSSPLKPQRSSVENPPIASPDVYAPSPMSSPEKPVASPLHSPDDERDQVNKRSSVSRRRRSSQENINVQVNAQQTSADASSSGAASSLVVPNADAASVTAGDPNAPVEEGFRLSKRSTRRFSMPSGKGILQFDV